MIFRAPSISRRQIHLSTAIVLKVIAASVAVGAGASYWKEKRFERSKAEVKTLIESFYAYEFSGGKSTEGPGPALSRNF